VVASALSLRPVTPAEKQTLPVWAGSVVLHGSDAAGLIPVAPEWMSALTQAPESNGFKTNWWATLRDCMQPE
jgi:hypothetical protein